MIVTLSPSLIAQILDYLDITAVPDSLDVQFLDSLMYAYSRRVPWESASRIARCTAVAEIEARPRWPNLFWQDAIKFGTGGTCFESNYAYLALLRRLGFEGYLTINNMGENIGCHSAIVVMLNGQKWLVDAGYPLYVTLPMSPLGVMYRSSPFLHYGVKPDGRQRFQIEQWPHPRAVAFTLIDVPISEADYRAHTVADYGENGRFLEAVIINKIIADEPWRFNMAERPWRLNRFDWGKRVDKKLAGNPATAVANHFGMAEHIMQTAFDATQSTK